MLVLTQACVHIHVYIIMNRLRSHRPQSLPQNVVFDPRNRMLAPLFFAEMGRAFYGVRANAVGVYSTLVPGHPYQTLWHVSISPQCKVEKMWIHLCVHVSLHVHEGRCALTYRISGQFDSYLGSDDTSGMHGCTPTRAVRATSKSLVTVLASCQVSNIWCQSGEISVFHHCSCQHLFATQRD